MRTGAVTTLEDPPYAAAPAGLAFRDRHDAGRRLAPLLERFRDELPVVVGMPRGGVPVAAEVARALDAPLDVVVVRKVGAPRNPEFAVGALAEGGVRVLSDETARALGLTEGALQALFTEVEAELSARTRLYRGARKALSVAGRTVILVDDGLATGRSASAAIASLRARGAARVVLAVPVAAPASVEALREQADEIVCVEMPEDLWAVGAWYEDFDPTSDEEVVALLEGRIETEVSMTLRPDVTLAGDLTVPAKASGLVIFAHGSGSSRLSRRNRSVAQGIVASGYATLLFDLLTRREERDRANVFDVPLLARRLLWVSSWAEAATARRLAARLFRCEHGRGRRPHRSGGAGQPRVGRDLTRRTPRPSGRPRRRPCAHAADRRGADHQVLELNRIAQRQLHCPNELTIVPAPPTCSKSPGTRAVHRPGGRLVGRHLAGRPGPA